MIDKQVIIDGVDVSGCKWFCKWNSKCSLFDCIYGGHPQCDNGELYDCDHKQLKRKEQDYEELRQYHNKCCEENAKKETEWLEKFNQISIGFYNGDYCNTEHCSLLKAKEQECKELKETNNTLAVTREKLLNDLWVAEESLKDYKVHYDKQCDELDQLKAENDNLKSLIWWIHIGAEGADKATTEYYENRNTPYEENYWKRIRALQPPTYESKYKLTLTEIKEIAQQYEDTPNLECKQLCCTEILQKISECEGNNGTKL